MMLRAYILFTIYVLIYYTASYILGKKIWNLNQDSSEVPNVCNIISGHDKADNFFWFLQRLFHYTLFKVPMLMIFWTKRSKKINKKPRS